MFVRALAGLWADRVAPLAPTPLAPDDEADELLAQLDAADGDHATALLAGADEAVVERAVVRALSLARAAVERAGEPCPPVGREARLLVRIGQRHRGVTTAAPPVPHQAVEGHGWLLSGLAAHFFDPVGSRRAYDLAFINLRNGGQEPLARAAAVAARLADTTGIAPRLPDEARDAVADLSVIDPEGADRLRPETEGYLAAVEAVNRFAADPEAGLVVGEDIDVEWALHFTEAALFLVGGADDDVAVSLARAADDIGARVGYAANAVDRVRRSLVGARRWSAAAVLLEEAVDRDPDDHNSLIDLVRACIELDRWDDAKRLAQRGLDSAPDDVKVSLLERLCLAGAMRNAQEVEGWREQLIALAPDRDPAHFFPVQLVGRPARLAFVEGTTLHVSPELLDLSDEDQQAQVSAAVIAADADPAPLLIAMRDESPELFARVAEILGVEELTEDQAQARVHLAEAERLFHSRKFREALDSYQRAHVLDPGNAEIPLFMGNAWYVLGDYHVAAACFEESIAIAPSPTAWRFLGDAIAEGRGDERAALKCYEEALRLAPDYGAAKGALKLIKARVGEEAPPRDFEFPNHQARMQALDSLPFGSGEAEGETRSTVSMGRNMLTALREAPGLAEVVVGIETGGPAFAAWLEGATPEQLVVGIELAGAVKFQLLAKDRDLPAARRWNEAAIAMAGALPSDYDATRSPLGRGRRRILAELSLSQGDFQRADGKLGAARSAYESAISLLATEEDERTHAGLFGESEHDQLFSSIDVRVILLERLSAVCQELGDLPAASAHFREARDRRRARPTSEAVIDGRIENATSLMLAGMANFALGELWRALKLAREDAPLAVASRALSKALNAMGQALFDLGLHATALARFVEAKELNERTMNADRLMHDHFWIGRVFGARPDLGDASPELETALRYASMPAAGDDAPRAWQAADGRWHSVTVPDRAWPVLVELGRAAAAAGDVDRGAHYLELAIGIGADARAGTIDPAERMAIGNGRVAASQALAQLRIGAVAGDGAPTAESQRAAWLSIESFRARTFLDVLGDSPLRPPPGVDPSLLEREADLLRRRSELRASGARDPLFWARHDELQAELAETWAAIAACAPEAESYVEVREGRPAEPADVLETLAGDPAPVSVVSMFFCDDGSLALSALRSGQESPSVSVVPLDRDRLERFVSGNFGAAARVRELAIDAAELLDHELACVASAVASMCEPGDTLVLCPTSFLHYVPLWAVSVDRRPLLERNPIVSLPNASLVRALRVAARVESDRPIDVFGDPTEDLPGARDEAIAVARRFNTEARLGPDACSDAVARSLAEAETVHLAAHAHFDGDDALRSGIALADRVLEARELLRMSLPSLGTVVLSACETGVSETNSAEELLGFTRALLFAGADSLLVSLWRVPDEPTRFFMDRYYEGVGTGARRVEAVRSAMLGAREQYGADRFDRWAGFCLVGDWR